MDCPNFFQHRSDPDYFYSVAHKMDPTIHNFVLYLSWSKNGIDNWEPVTELEREASQGKVWLSPDSDDILLAFETSPGMNGNHIVLKQYPNLQAMKRQEASETLHIERTLGKLNEGTPSFEKVEFTGSLSTSNITLRFHYYHSNNVD